MLVRAQVLVCGGTGCLSSKSQQIKDAFVENIKALGLDNEIQVIQTGCFVLQIVFARFVVIREFFAEARVQNFFLTAHFGL